MDARTFNEQVLADCHLVTQHVLRDPNCDYAIHAKSHRNARLTMQVADAPLADPGALATVVNWVRMAMANNAHTRALTSEEVLVLAAATRINEILEMLDTFARCSQAFAANDLDEARRLWTELTPHHTFIISFSPLTAYFDAALYDQATARATPATH
ncbi:MAG: hypothetical protein AB7H93_13335 [Vicinamibacterales bacterium]